ncbi:U-box domain-containing protein 45-like protein, partial [Tanacetum coccineum]
AITGDSVVMKFERARSALEDSLRRVEDIVPQTIGCQISNILAVLEGVEFSLDPLEKQVGDEIIGLLQEGKNFNSSCDNNELETFHQAASKLGITSSRGALRERRALKKLVEKARHEDDKRKESIVAYLLHLMRKYSKLFRSDFSDDNDSQGGSTPCSPTVNSPFEGGLTMTRGQLSKMSSFNFKPNFRRSGQMSVPPEELRCPISLQLMYDPVIIASGQTYERICIEKWFADGHNTCPKTQQTLAHLCLTPNYCVKGLVASWCEQNGVLVPEGPPDSLDVNYWNLSLTENELPSSRLSESVGSCKYDREVDELEAVPENEGNVFESYEDLLTVLNMGDENNKLKAIDQIRYLSKDDEEARMFMGENGFVEALLRFLESTVYERNVDAQQSAAMALFNLSVNNNRNKESLLAAGVLPLLEEMIRSSGSPGAVAALCLNIASLEQAKPIIGSSDVVPFLISVLEDGVDPECKSDALHSLYHLSTYHSNIPRLVSLGILNALQPLIDDNTCTEIVIAVLTNMVNLAKDDIISTPGLVSALSSVLDGVEPMVQEQAAAFLLILCTKNEKCIQMVLQEGVIPSLVSISANGTARGKQKALKLLMLFREQRHREPPTFHIDSPEQCEISDNGVGNVNEEVKSLAKSVSKRKLGRAWTSLWRNKSLLVNQC